MRVATVLLSAGLDDDLTAIPDPADRAIRAAALITGMQAAIDELSRVRRAAILEMVNAGMPYRQIGQRLGIAAPRVSQIVNAKPVVRTVVRTVTVTGTEGEA